METYLIFKYQTPPGASEQDATTLTEFKVEAGSGMLVPADGEVVELPVEEPQEQEERQKEYRVVRRSHVFSGSGGKITTQYIQVIVTDPEE